MKILNKNTSSLTGLVGIKSQPTHICEPLGLIPLLSKKVEFFRQRIGEIKKENEF